MTQKFRIMLNWKQNLGYEYYLQKKFEEVSLLYKQVN